MRLSLFRSPLRPIVLAYPLLWAVAFLIGCNTGPNLTLEEHITRAKEYQGEGKIRAAVIELKNALQKTPDNTEARRLLGQAYLKAGNGVGAEKELRRALELGLPPETVAVPLAQAGLRQGKFQQVLDDPVDPQGLPKKEQAKLLALRGHAYLGLSELGKAEKFYDSALSINPDTPEAGFGKARIATTQNRLEETREWLGKVLQATPNFAPAWSLLGDLERYQGNAQEAEQAYGKAIAHRLNNASDLLNRTLVRIYLKKYDGAASDIKTLNKRTPNHPGVAYAQGLLNFQQQKYPEALAAFQKALNQNREYMPAVLYAGLSHYMQGQLEQAERHLSRFLARFPQSDVAAKVFAAVQFSKGDYEGAESVLKPLLARNPNDTRALTLMGDIALRQGKAKEGTDYFQKVMVQEPASATAYMKLGLGLEFSGEHEQSRQMLEKALELEPQLPQADLMMILSHLRAREFDQAIAAAQRMHEKYPDSPDPLTLMGGAYLAKGEELKAREAFEQALQIMPGTPSAAHNLAQLELRKGEVEKARSLYLEVLKHQPGHLSTLVSLAQLEAQQGQMEQAMARLAYAVKEHPEALQPQVLLASYYLRMGQPSRALAVMQNIPKEQANHPSVLGVIGEAQLALKQPPNALVTFKKLVSRAPKSARAHERLAQAYAAAGQLDHSREELEKVLELQPDNVPAQIMIARLLRLENKIEEAAQRLEKVKQTHANDPRVLTEQGWLAVHQNRYQEAVETFEKVVQLAPNSALTVALATAQWRAGDQDGSIETFKAWLAQHPGDLPVRLQLANTYLLLDQQEEAQSAYAQVLKEAPNNVVALNNLAWLLQEDYPEKAIKFARQALELAPEAPPVMDTLGVLLVKRGQTTEALKHLKKAYKKAPANPDIGYHLAQAWVQKGNNNNARQILTQILQNSAEFASRQAAEALLHALDERS